MMYKYSNQAQPEVGYNELFITFSSLIRLDYHALKLNMWCTLAIGEKTLRRRQKMLLQFYTSTWIYFT